MAVIKNIQEIQRLIPFTGGDGVMNTVSDFMINHNPLFAFVFEPNSKRFIKLFPAVFVAFRDGYEASLIIKDKERSFNVKTLAKNINFRSLLANNDNEWGFKSNETGLYLETTKPAKYEVYFSTNYEDLAELKESKENDKVLVVDKVYV